MAPANPTRLISCHVSLTFLGTLVFSQSESQEGQAFSPFPELVFPEFSSVSLVLVQSRRRWVWELGQCLFRYWPRDLCNAPNNYPWLYLEIHKRQGLFSSSLIYLSRALTRNWRGITGLFQSNSCLSSFPQ